MKNLLLTLAALIGLSATSAYGDSLKPMHALSLDLGDRTAVIFYTEHNGAFEVVTTVGPKDSDSRIVRHVATLNQNEDYTVSISGDHASSAARHIDIRRSGNEIHIAMRVSDNIVAQASGESRLQAQPPMTTF